MPAKENRLRRALLSALYERFKATPMIPVELGELADELAADRSELRWNAAYLSLAGYLTVRSMHSGSGQGLELTAEGIDLVEDQHAFRARLPLRSRNKS